MPNERDEVPRAVGLSVGQVDGTLVLDPVSPREYELGRVRARDQAFDGRARGLECGRRQRAAGIELDVLDAPQAILKQLPRALHDARDLVERWAIEVEGEGEEAVVHRVSRVRRVRGLCALLRTGGGQEAQKVTLRNLFSCSRD